MSCIPPCHNGLIPKAGVTVFEFWTALEDGILVTATLARLWPPPVRRVVGTLAQTHLVLQRLGVKVLAA